ncbi:hypothetical protein IF2G_10965 [Cordyceps javanica]|nr:hypothetical protein IF2G_10965 [Cordyceps javanica]
MRYLHDRIGRQEMLEKVALGMHCTVKLSPTHSRRVAPRRRRQSPTQGSRQLSLRRHDVLNRFIRTAWRTPIVGFLGVISAWDTPRNDIFLLLARKVEPRDNEHRRTSGSVESQSSHRERSRQRVLQPELDGSRRDEESLSGEPRYAEGARVADTGENAEVGELGHDDQPQAQNGRRSADTRLESTQHDLVECQVDEIVDSDAESDNESASFAIRQPAVAQQGSTKRKQSATKQDMASGLQKRRQISGFSAQRRCPNEAFRHSSSDSAGAQNGDVADRPIHRRMNHGTEDRPAQYRGPQVGMRNLTAGGGVSQAHEKVAGNTSDTTQEVDWSPLTKGCAATNIPQWRLPNATLLGVDLDEDGFLQYKIAGSWNLVKDDEPSFSGTAATVWLLSIGGSLNLVKSNDSIEMSFGMPWKIEPVYSTRR